MKDLVGVQRSRATWRPRGLSKSVVSRVISRVTPFRVLVTLLITHLLRPLGLQVHYGFSYASSPKTQTCYSVYLQLSGRYPVIN